MAGDWIKMRFDLAEDPAVMRMADKLKTREEHIVGYCHAFWCWVSRQCHDGTVTGVTLESLGRRLSLPTFPEMLVDVGWLEYDDSGEEPVIRIPNFERHLSQGAKTRILAAERQRKSRHADVTKTSRNERDKSVTREEKRREEKNKKTSSSLYTALFNKFWDAYPKRDGKKVGKRASAKLFASLPPEDKPLAVMAAGIYAKSRPALDGFAKDPERFLKADFWRDWTEPPDGTNPQQRKESQNGQSREQQRQDANFDVLKRFADEDGVREVDGLSHRHEENRRLHG